MSSSTQKRWYDILMECDNCGVAKVYPCTGRDLGRTGIGVGDKEYNCICENCGKELKAQDGGLWVVKVEKEYVK